MYQHWNCRAKCNWYSIWIALENKTVFVYAISSFIYSRAYEQIKLNLCSMNLKFVLLQGPGYAQTGQHITH